MGRQKLEVEPFLSKISNISDSFRSSIRRELSMGHEGIYHNELYDEFFHDIDDMLRVQINKNLNHDSNGT